MSEINEEEINEVNEELIQKENVEDEVVGDIKTEQETEPMEVMEEKENEVVIDEEKHEIMDNTNDKELERKSENIEEVQQQEETEVNGMNIDYDKSDHLEYQEVEENNMKVSSIRSSQQEISSIRSSHQNIGSKKNSISELGSNSKLNKSSSIVDNNNNGNGMIDKAFTEPASDQNQMRIYNGPIYSIEQVRIPPELPDIMKNYAKHIIRTQPDDVIVESYEYFKILNKLRSTSLDNEIDDDENDKPRKSSHISMNKKNNASQENSNYGAKSDNDEKSKNNGNSQTLELESFYERLFDYSDGKDTILASEIRNLAEDANISQSRIDEAIIVGSWGNEVNWLNFWALIVAGLCPNLKETINVIMDIIGDDDIIYLKKMTSIIEFLLESDPNYKDLKSSDIVNKLKSKDGNYIEKSEISDIIADL